MEELKIEITNIFEDIIGAIMKDPVSMISFINDCKDGPLKLRDAAFLDSMQCFLENVYEPTDIKGTVVNHNLKSLAVVLAEASPNYVAGYEGNMEVLKEYARRLVKLIDDCGTHKKAVYLSSLTRAVISGEIDTSKYFKLAHCLMVLTEEDLIFLNNNISKDYTKSDDDYIDDFVALGLMRLSEVEGYFYTKRAFELKKYALDYEGNISIPDSFPGRAYPQITDSTPEEEIEKLFEMKKDKIIEESKPKWLSF